MTSNRQYRLSQQDQDRNEIDSKNSVEPAANDDRNELHATKIEVCVNNLDVGAQAISDFVQAHYPSIHVQRWDCLGYCHLCIRQPGVLIDDVNYVQAPTVEALRDKVQQYIETGQVKDSTE